MNAKVEKEFRFDLFKWIVVVALVVGAAIANSYYSEILVLYRVLALVVVAAVAAAVAVNTEKGFAFWELLKGAQVELRKVVWPTGPEITQTTLIVVAVVIVTGFILWGLDSLLGYLFSLIIA